MFDDLQCVVKSISNGIVFTDDVQYGPMTWHTAGGLLFCSYELDDLEYTSSPMMVGDRFFGASIQRCDKQSQPSVFAQRKEDVLKVAQRLSRDVGETQVIIHARIVARFVDGDLVGEVKSLDEFYNNLTEDEVNATDLTPYVGDLKES